MGDNSYHANAIDQLKEDIEKIIIQYQKELENEMIVEEKESVLESFLTREAYENLNLDMFGLCAEEKGCGISRLEARAADLKKKIAELKNLKDDIEREDSYQGILYAAE